MLLVFCSWKIKDSTKTWVDLNSSTEHYCNCWIFFPFRREALHRWVKKHEKHATYRKLITAFYKSGKLDYCTVVIKALQEDEYVLPPVCAPNPPTVESVMEALTDITRWDDLGICLGIDQCDIEEIQQRHSNESTVHSRHTIFSLTLKACSYTSPQKDRPDWYHIAKSTVFIACITDEHE